MTSNQTDPNDQPSRSDDAPTYVVVVECGWCGVELVIGPTTFDVESAHAHGHHVIFGDPLAGERVNCGRCGAATIFTATFTVTRAGTPELELTEDEVKPCAVVPCPEIQGEGR